MDSDERVADLERLVRDNADLERLEAIAADFNPFVAMGWTHQEVRHSAFLRWLLDPTETHGLGSYPLRQFLKYVLIGSSGVGNEPTVFDADTWNLETTTVVTESEQIDLLIRNDDDRFVVVIENKVGSSEHGNQLQRYRALIENRFPDYKHGFVYLTPTADSASDPAYRNIGYSEIMSLVEGILERRQGQLSDEVRGFFTQYAELVRRHIVEDSEIQELCRRLYSKHRRALDLIFENRPDRALEVSGALQEAISATPGLYLDQCSKAYIRFSTDQLNAFPTVGEGWTKTGRLILFELGNSNERVTLKLILGPGPAEIRELIRERVQEHREVFNRAHYKFYPQWWTFHGRGWLPTKRYRDTPLEELRAEFGRMFGSFVANELPALEAPLQAAAQEINAMRQRC